jgi:hypothetical protein
VEECHHRRLTHDLVCSDLLPGGVIPCFSTEAGILSLNRLRLRHLARQKIVLRSASTAFGTAGATPYHRVGHHQFPQHCRPGLARQ